MFYKMRNILVAIFSFGMVLTISNAKAQGVVSLSEEAMFEDELDTVVDTPEANQKNNSAEVPLVAANAPETAPSVQNQAPEVVTPSATVTPENPSAETVPNPEVTNTESVEPADEASILENGIEEAVSGDLFERMSDIEKKTTLLNLELRREKLKTEIEAVKNQRRQAVIEEQRREEEARMKALEAEKKLEAELVAEQNRLRELDIKFETLRQEKVLTAYKNKMLEEQQKWIANNALFYKQISELQEAKKALSNDMKTMMNDVKDHAKKAKEAHADKLALFVKNIKDKEAQISILRSRIDTLEREREEAKKNPFAGLTKEQIAEAVGVDMTQLNVGSITSSGGKNINSEPVETNLSKLYAVTEIRGRGDELIARLINKSGTSFYVKKGTALQSGHVVSEITTTYVAAEKSGERNYLYFAAGGILPTETSGFEIDSEKEEENKTVGPKPGSID